MGVLFCIALCTVYAVCNVCANIYIFLHKYTHLNDDAYGDDHDDADDV